MVKLRYVGCHNSVPLAGETSATFPSVACSLRFLSLNTFIWSCHFMLLFATRRGDSLGGGTLCIIYSKEVAQFFEL